jgi:CCR4-NOT complex subunit CAF16
MDAERYPERRDRLIELLDINMDWHMNQVSDGERRRVQIFLGLLEPFQLLLLDEVTVDLDVLVRRKLLDFLKKETAGREGNPGTIIYASHIFDGLGTWPTHVAHIRTGEIAAVHPFDNFPELDAAKSTSGFDSPLLTVVEQWLGGDAAATRIKRQQIASSKTTWDRLSEDVRKHGDKFYNYWG